MTTNGTNGWSKDKQLVEFRLSDADKRYEKIFSMLWELKEDLAEIKVKAGVWGIIGGSIPVLITILTGLFIWMVKS